MKYFFVILVVFFVIGILFANFFASFLSLKICLLLLACLFCCSFLLIKKQYIFYFFLCVIFFCLGIVRYLDVIVVKDNDISKFLTNKRIHGFVYGTIVSDVKQYDMGYAVFDFYVERVLFENKEYRVKGIIRVKSYKKEIYFQIGERYILEGYLSTPFCQRNPYGFDYKSYLKYKKINTTMFCPNKDLCFKVGCSKKIFFFIKRKISVFREGLKHIIDKCFSKKNQFFIESIFLGFRGNMPLKIRDLFIKTSSMHILSVSGLHISLIGIFLFFLLRYVVCSKTLKVIFVVFCLFLFSVLSGTRISSVRALLMVSFFLFNMLIGRKVFFVSIIFVSIFFILFFSPGFFFDAGFVLSYLAVLSIVYLVPLTDSLFLPDYIEKQFFRNKFLFVLKINILKILSVSLAIWIGVLPFIILYFNIITFFSIIYNIFVIPIFFIILVLSFFVLGFGYIPIFSNVALFLGKITNFILDFFMFILNVFSKVPFSYVRIGTMSPFFIFLFYLALIISIFCFLKKQKKIYIFLFLLFAINLFLCNEFPKKDLDSLIVTFFDVGRADSAILEFPDSKVMLIDGGSLGSKGGKQDAGSNIIAPYLFKKGIKRINCIFLTHPHKDHIGGMFYILENFKVDMVIDGVDESIMEKYEKIFLYKKFKDLIEKNKIKYLHVKKGDIITVFDDIKIFVLNACNKYNYKNLNNSSLVLKLVTNKNNSLLFCADIEEEGLTDLLNNSLNIKSDIVKMPHHGLMIKNNYIIDEFLNNINCQYAIITNYKKGVDKKILKMLQNRKVDVFITGEKGAIIAKETKQGFNVKEFSDNS